MSEQNEQKVPAEQAVPAAELSDETMENVAGGGIVTEVYNVVNEIWTEFKGGADVCK